MKRLLSIIFLALLVGFPGFVVQGSMKEALILYKKNRFDESVKMLAPLAAQAPQDDQTQLSYGLACMANAKLYDQLFEASKEIQLDYLARLTKNQKAKDSSKVALLIQGKALLDADQPKAAIGWLTKFLSSKGVSSTMRTQALAALGTAQFLLGDKKGANKSWGSISPKSPLNQLLLAGAYQQAGYTEPNPLALAEKAHTKLGKNEDLPIEAANRLIAVYVANGKIDKAMAVAFAADLSSFLLEEKLGKNKTIRFYELSLLQNLADLYAHASLKPFSQASKSSAQKVKNIANYYLSEAYAQLGNIQETQKYLSAFIASTNQPPAYLKKAKVEQTWLQTGGKGSTADLNPYMKGSSDVAEISTTLSICTRSNIRCSKAVAIAKDLWNGSSGRPAADLSQALGGHFLKSKDPINAVFYLEGSRDKSRKNQIDANPPALLVSLARAYLKTKQYSEALEIYFEMSKQFPAVRQIQVALQGIYSMEQKSAGNANLL